MGAERGADGRGWGCLAAWGLDFELVGNFFLSHDSLAIHFIGGIIAPFADFDVHMFCFVRLARGRTPAWGLHRGLTPVITSARRQSVLTKKGINRNREK